MKTVNQLFINSTNQLEQEFTVKGYVSKTKDGTVLATLTTEDFTENGIVIQTKAVGGSSFDLGGVNIGTCKLTLTQSGITKLTTAGCLSKRYCIHLVMWNKVNDNNQSTTDLSKNTDNTENTTGKCELGYYYFSTIKATPYSCSIDAFDILVALDENISNEALSLLQDAENKVTLSEITTIIEQYTNTRWYSFAIDFDSNTLNSSATFCLDTDYNPSTYRDVLQITAKLAGGFAMSDEDGNIKIRKFSNSEDESIAVTVVLSADFDASSSEIGRFYSQVAGFDFNKTYQVTQGNEDITYYMEENPLLRGIEEVGAEELSQESETALTNIADMLGNFGGFIGGVVTLLPKPYLEIGDNVTINYIKANTDGTISNLSKSDVLIATMDLKVGNNMRIESKSTVANTNVTSTAKKKTSTSSGGSKTSTGGLVVLAAIIDDGVVIDSGGTDICTLSCVVAYEEGDVFIHANLIVEASADGDITPVISCNGDIIGNITKKRVFSGTYSYDQGLALPADNKATEYTFKLSAIGNGETIKQGSGLSVIAGGLKKMISESSDASYFNFDVSWLSLSAGLYDIEGNLLATWAELVSAGLNLATANSRTTNASVLDSTTYGNSTDRILVIDGSVFTSTVAVGSYYSSKVSTLVFKNGVKIRTPFSPGYSSTMDTGYRYALKRLYVSNDCTLYSSSTRPWNLINYDPYVTLFTDATPSSNTGFVANTYWRIKSSSSSDKLPVIYSISQNTNLNYTVKGGTTGAGLVFNASDINLAPGLYDSANRQIVDWNTLVSLGIEEITQNLESYTSPGSGQIPISVAYLYNKATKLIIPDTITTIGDVQFAGNADLQVIRGSNLKVIIFKGAVTLGRNCFIYNNQITDLYIPVNSQAYNTNYSPFTSVSANIKIYTDASDDENHTFAVNNGIITSSSSVPTSNSNVIYNAV